MWKSVFSQLRRENSVIVIDSDMLKFSGKIEIAMDEYVSLSIKTASGKVTLKVEYRSIVAVNAENMTWVTITLAGEKQE